MGWWGHGIYDDGNRGLHYDFIKWAKIEKDNDVIETFLDDKTIIPKDKIHLLKKNSGLILKKMKKPKFWDEYSAIKWHMLLSLYLDNSVVPPKIVIKNGIEATEYLAYRDADDYSNPSARRRVLRNFITKVEKMVNKGVIQKNCKNPEHKGNK